MFVRLTKPARARAGWFAALLYLFCVLAPGTAMALGDAASCLEMKVETAAAATVHDASHQHHLAHGDHADASAVHDEPAEPQHHDKSSGKASPGACCALLCVSAIAADLPAFATPSQPISLCLSENFQRLPGKAPPLLYRPPIA